MDVRLPDGTVVTNVPEGISQSDLMRRLGRSSAPVASTDKQNADLYAGEDVGQMGAVRRGLGGAKAAWDRAAMGLKGVFTDLTPEDKAMLEQGKAFSKEGGTAATVGGIGADIAMSAAPAMRGAQLTSAAVQNAPRLVKALASAGSQLGIGAGYGALTNPENRSEGAQEGAIGTAVGMGANRLIGGALKPLMSEDAVALLRRGIVPTPGQAVGGVANQIEQKLQSVPLMGDVIRGGRNRATREFNEAAIQTAAPGVKGAGDEALTAAREQIGKRYDNVLDNLPNVTVDKASILQSTRNAIDDPALALSDDSKKFVLNYVNNNLLARSGQIDGQVAKKIESDFAAAVARKATGDAEDRAVADAMRNVQQQWRQSLTQTAEAVNPGSGAALREADASWRAFIPLDKAASSAGSQAAETAGQFTPRALRRAIEASDKSQFNNATRAMRGGTTPFDELNTLTRQGERVLTNNVPDSGTASRLMTTLGALGGGAAGVAGYGVPVAVGTAGALGAYSRPGSRFMLEGVEPVYKALLLRGYVPAQLDKILQESGPQALITLARGAALNQN